MEKKIFIGGAWPYANYLLHVGHLAALLPGDVIARYYRLNGDQVIYVSGTDTHGTPITMRAKKEGVSPKEIATYYHEKFSETFDKMNFSYDLYTSTMENFHMENVKEYLKILIANGYIYEKEEGQDYCDRCKKFLSDREIIGVCPKCGGKATGDQCDECLTSLNTNEVMDRHCKECGGSTILKNNKHLYFKLSAFQEELEKLVNSYSSTWRTQAVGESKKFLEMQLIDRAVTRQLDWGVEVPVDGYDDKRIYVWIEAVLGYLTAGKKYAQSQNINFDEFLSKENDNLRTYFVHGKDNIPFHTIIFPALISGLSKSYQLPKYIISSGYVNMNDEKMSKSKGNLITVDELVDKFNADSIRYYMIANGPEKKDVNFNEFDLIQAHNKFLVGALGNFINRNLSFIKKKFDGHIAESNIDLKIKEVTQKEYKLIGNLIENGELRSAIENVMEYISLGNKYYDDRKPWIQVKENIKDFNETTYTCIYMMANIANLISPFMPDTAQKIRKILNISELKWEENNIHGDFEVNEIPLLFDRIDVKKKINEDDVENEKLKNHKNR